MNNNAVSPNNERRQLDDKGLAGFDAETEFKINRKKEMLKLHQKKDLILMILLILHVAGFGQQE